MRSAEATRRTIPGVLDEDGRRSFVEIAARAQAERAHTYTTVCLGLQSFLTAERLRTTVASQDAADHSASE